MSICFVELADIEEAQTWIMRSVRRLVYFFLLELKLASLESTSVMMPCRASSRACRIMIRESLSCLEYSLQAQYAVRSMHIC